jgi:hypothetical protein
MTAWFDFLLPQSWRRRAPARPERNDAVIGRLNDNDPVYRALMDAALSQFEGDVCRLMDHPNTLTEAERTWFAGRANAMAAWMTGIQKWKEGAIQDEINRGKQRHRQA